MRWLSPAKLCGLVWVAFGVVVWPVSAEATPTPNPWFVADQASPQATPPPDCNASYDVYGYTESALQSCGVKTFPRTDLKTLSGGGHEYDYVVDGALYRYYVPPPGFDATKATAAELDEYGLPPRPTGVEDLATWTTQMTDLRVVPPPPFLVESNASADSVTSQNWSGYAVTGGNGAFTHAETWFYQPTYQHSACASNAATIWAGIGGYYNDALGQDGTVHEEGGALGGGWFDGQAFTEVWPNQNMVPQSFGADPGDEYDASVRRISGGYRFYMYDYQLHWTFQTDAMINNYTGTAAEAIAERPSVNNAPVHLSNFGSMYFQNTYANGTGIDNWSPTGGRHGIHMQAGSTDFADPGDLFAGGAFTDVQHHCM